MDALEFIEQSNKVAEDDWHCEFCKTINKFDYNEIKSAYCK